MLPPPSVLTAFGCSGEPARLTGGQGTAYRSGEIILKPIDNPVEAAWTAELFDTLSGPGFRVPTPLRDPDGQWVVQGWVAWRRFPGEHVSGRWDERLEACGAFHRALAGYSRPGFLSLRADPWEISDRMTWGEQPIECLPLTQTYVDRVLPLLGESPSALDGQLVHGDICGNFLFADTGPPCVIDFAPYWRPAEFASAVLVVDAVTWQGADPSWVDSSGVSRELLARAALRRILEHDLHYRMRSLGDPGDVRRYETSISRLERATP